MKPRDEPPKIRKQYYFRPSANGFFAWDVDRLIALSAGFPVHRVPLSEIRELDEPFHLDDAGDPPTGREIAEHARLVREADLAYPIILAADGRVMDGMHRVMKALAAGLDAIDAVRFEGDPEPDHVDVRPEDLPY